jgi:hypothetical protein
MVCGIDTNILALDGLKETLEKQVKSLSKAPRGMAANLGSLKSVVSKEMKAIVKKLDETLPGLAGLIPKATLQGDMTALLGMISNPAGFASQAASIVSKYGTVPGVDIAGLASSILSGNISADTICKFIPNVEIDALNNVIKKGVIPVPPAKEVEALVKIFDGLKQADAKKVFDNAYSSLVKGADLVKRAGDGLAIAKLADSVSSAKCPGGIMAAMGQTFQTTFGTAMPPEIIKAMEGAPGSLTLACGSADLEEKLNKFQEMIQKEQPKLLATLDSAGDIVKDQLGEMSGVLANFPVAEMQASLTTGLTAFQANFSATEADEGGGGSGGGTVDGGDEDGTAATVSGDADTSGA